MEKSTIILRALAAAALALLPVCQASGDGGYFSRQSVAVSADQRAIIIKNGDEISQ